jgi:hypothetical protein
MAAIRLNLKANRFRLFLYFSAIILNIFTSRIIFSIVILIEDIR